MVRSVPVFGVRGKYFLPLGRIVSGGSFLAQPERTGYNPSMVNWRRFRPTDFEYDFDADKLAAHRVTFEEAVECFFSSRSFSNSNRTRSFESLQGGRYEDEASTALR